MSDIVLWRGRPVEELTREELIEAVKEAASLYHTTIELALKERDLQRQFREARSQYAQRAYGNVQ